ncbi:DUF4274 domain-containing protein [Dysgonomonas sp. 521]|uniref:DUF4274 domain-containing protein n=1 Tax=Dysgonomonas sp. 521 TaxID=2302932 RepID=UPI0013D0C186|nr:DUF4274 domain-containing protein [Dysgonomonas sp. 521]NDV94631.1 DUF4274 domain-containing protein [Dysgonomonas sp. 521]
MDEQRGLYIEQTFREDPNLDIGALSKLDTYDLHYLADIVNWDIQVPHLQWITEQPLCSKATALMIFWRAYPQEYQRYKWDANAKSDQDVFDLIKTIITNYEKGFYSESDIHYSPQDDMGEPELIPDIMFQAVSGEEPYSLYESLEVLSWFGEYLETRIERCHSAMELYGIACHITKPEAAEHILKHPMCDKGIALMIFWRLNAYANIFAASDLLQQEIITKIQNDQYPEVIAYNPKKDKEVKVVKAKNKWEIPEIMKNKV